MSLSAANLTPGYELFQALKAGARWYRTEQTKIALILKNAIEVGKIGSRIGGLSSRGI
jgi:hypothetical protein